MRLISKFGGEEGSEWVDTREGAVRCEKVKTVGWNCVEGDVEESDWSQEVREKMEEV